MEDFAQVFGLFPDEKYGRRSYANIASVLRAEAAEGDTYEFLRHLVFSVLIGNGDMHLKNGRYCTLTAKRRSCRRLTTLLRPFPTFQETSSPSTSEAAQALVKLASIKSGALPTWPVCPQAPCGTLFATSRADKRGVGRSGSKSGIAL